MSFILKMEHEWNQNKNGYLGNSSTIGYYVTDDIHAASVFSNLEEVRELLEESANEGVLDIEGVNYIIAEAYEVEMQIKSKRKVSEILHEIKNDALTARPVMKSKTPTQVINHGNSTETNKINTQAIKQALKAFTTKTNLQRRQPQNSMWEIYTAYYLQAPYESLNLFMRVYMEQDAIEIELLRKEKWDSIDFLTEHFPYELDKYYVDEEDLGMCQQFLFHFHQNEDVFAFLDAYLPYVKDILAKRA